MTTEVSLQARTGSILVVDDDAAIADMIVEVLTDEGYVVVQVSNGASALTSIAHLAPALILLDLHLPDINGAQIMQRLAAMGHTTTPVVLMTASPQAVAPLLGSENISCLAKPFALDDLLACVAHYMRPTLGADGFAPIDTRGQMYTQSHFCET